MTGNHPAALLRRLNPYCTRALDAAASLCQTRAHAEITIEHWLLKLLEQGEGHQLPVNDCRRCMQERNRRTCRQRRTSAESAAVA